MGHSVDEERLFKMGTKLATAFWDAAVLGDRWRGKATVPHSPMSALARLYGTQGPLRAIGVPPGALPLDMTVRCSLPHRRAPHTTSGLLATSVGAFLYTLRWQTAQGNVLVGEVLPHPCSAGALVAASSLPLAVGDQLLKPPPPRIALDPVEAQIWEETIGIHGLCFVVRCLALWWQVKAAPDAKDHAAGVMAAAVVERMQGRAGLRPRIAGQSTLWSPDSTSMRRAMEHIDRLIGAPKTRPW